MYAVVPVIDQSSFSMDSGTNIIQPTSPSKMISISTINQSVNTPVKVITSQTVNFTANESNADGSINSATIAAIVASVTGGLLCIIGVCAIVVLIKKYKNRNNRKMNNMDLSSVSFE